MGRLEEIAQRVLPKLVLLASGFVQAGCAALCTQESRAERQGGVSVAGAEPAERGQTGGVTEDVGREMVYVGEKSLQEIIDNRVEPGRAAELMKWNGYEIYVLDVCDNVIERKIFDGIDIHFLEQFHKEQDFEVETTQPRDSPAHCYRMDRVAAFFTSVGELDGSQRAVRDILKDKGLLVWEGGVYNGSSASALVAVPNNLVRYPIPEFGGDPRSVIVVHELAHASEYTDRRFHMVVNEERRNVAQEKVLLWQAITQQQHPQLALEERTAHLVTVMVDPRAVARLRWLAIESLRQDIRGQEYLGIVQQYIGDTQESFSGEDATPRSQFFLEAARMYQKIEGGLPPELRNCMTAFRKLFK